ncbi:FAD-dependent oxidoreductase [Leptolyngbya ohadii]|uniref:FAD-dependent oxidoreductase n=1 Tax=Leptolyngbya ohadii TaxID=1962290 RepID=UPI000B599B36|nr:FAD-dependent oxidoreductase [Leptolyngbya ohadii]
MRQKTEVLVVGGGAGGTAAAIQAARAGVQTILVSEFGWLGGMLTAAGVAAPDGNELLSFQTGLWGAFLRELQQRQPEGLDHAWVSFFTYEPRIGFEIFEDWVRQLPSLHWISGQTPCEVIRQGNRVTAVQFQDWTIAADIIIDATELGDVLALAEVPHRWGWEWQSEFGEPSAPVERTPLTDRFPVQAPTWVFLMQDFGAPAEQIPASPDYNADRFAGTWEGYGAELFLNYGRLPRNRFMLNFPQQGNDYGVKLDRLVESEKARQEFLQEAFDHAQGYAHFLQNALKSELGDRYGLATDSFPSLPPKQLGGGAFALHPYFRESRRLRGLVTVCEQDILPVSGGQVAALPMNEAGQVESIVIGNYANDHHYPGDNIPLKPKSLRWGGRWTGTPFSLPYRCLIPAEVEGLLVCEKNISVSHMANGATRLQPVVLGLGQAAGMAAALCVQRRCPPQELPVRDLQTALLKDPIAPAAVIPLFNVTPQNADWLHWQQHFLDRPEDYPISGTIQRPDSSTDRRKPVLTPFSQAFKGTFERRGEQNYQLHLTHAIAPNLNTLSLVTLDGEVDRLLQTCVTGQTLTVVARLNRSGSWLLVEAIHL